METFTDRFKFLKSRGLLSQSQALTTDAFLLRFLILHLVQDKLREFVRFHNFHRPRY